MAITRNHQAEYKHWQAEEVRVIEGKAVRFRDICVHTFNVGDAEDPDLYAGEPIWKWQQTDAGKWIMENAIEPPYWARFIDHNQWGYNYKIMARLSEQNITYFKLKFSK